MTERNAIGRATVIMVLALAAAVGCEARDTVQLADGQRVSFDEWDGRWLIINYWAEWCAPCRKEIPELNLVHSERSATDAVVLGVNYDGLTGDKLADLAAEMGIEFPVLVEDPRGRWGVELPGVLPSTIIVDPSGAVADVLVGPQHYEDLIRAISARPSDRNPGQR